MGKYRAVRLTAWWSAQDEKQGNRHCYHRKGCSAYRISQMKRLECSLGILSHWVRHVRPIGLVEIDTVPACWEDDLGSEAIRAIMFTETETVSLTSLCQWYQDLLTRNRVYLPIQGRLDAGRSSLFVWRSYLAKTYRLTKFRSSGKTTWQLDDSPWQTKLIALWAMLLGSKLERVGDPNQ